MSTPTSPKVKWGAVAGVGAALLGAWLAALIADPSGLGFDLPPWVVFTLLSTGPVAVGFLAAYAKRDPLRDAGQVHLLEIPDGTGEHRADGDDEARGGFTRPV